MPDVYLYDTIPNALRVQIVHILRDCLGNNEQYYSQFNRVEAGYNV